jgi:hypothetical protein
MEDARQGDAIETAQPRSADIFISYSRKDIAFARLIRSSLQASGLDTWIDWDRIPVGERWWDEICRAIERSNVFMFIISASSTGSPVCRDEINQAPSPSAPALEVRHAADGQADLREQGRYTPDRPAVHFLDVVG